ncbi:hypothetical protein COOONC_20099, partial [Cooperia oncophora]
MRSNRQLTLDFLSLYATLLSHIRSDPSLKKEFPTENGDSFISILAWLYTEFSTDKKMCHVIEEIFSLIEQIRPHFLEHVVNFILMEICRVSFAKESWPALVRFIIMICRRLQNDNVSDAFRYFAILLDGGDTDDFTNESEVPRGLIAHAEESLVNCEYDRAKVITDCLGKWKEEASLDRSIAEVFNEADRSSRIACCALRLAEEERAAAAAEVVDEGQVMQRSAFIRVLEDKLYA